MIERVNDSVKLGDYMQTHMFGPLGLHDLTLNLASRPDLRSRLVQPTRKVSDGRLTVGEHNWPEDPRDHCGGWRLCWSSREYFELLRAVLARDERLLKSSETWDLV